MEVTVRKYTDEALMRRACEMTFNGKSHQSLLSIYKSEHSPARTQLFWIEFVDVPLFVATHFIRHHVGVVPFELSRRDDRSNDVTFDVAIKSVNDQLTDLLDHILKGEKDIAQCLIAVIQNELESWTEKYDRMVPVKLGLCINAQSLIDMSKLRLCNMAHVLTIKAMREVKAEVAKVDESLAKMMVRKCVYRGGICGEPHPCKFNRTPAFRKEFAEYMSAFYNEQRPYNYEHPDKNLPENTEELMQYILERLCALTGNVVSAIKSKCRMWSLMYARYIFFDVATKFNVKPSVAVNYIGRNRTLMYPYKRAVSDLYDVNAQFRVDCNAVYESTFDHFDCDYGRT